MSARGNKANGAAAFVALVVVALTAKACLAQPLHQPLESRHVLTPHPSAAVIGGPARPTGARPGEARFPVSPAGAVHAKAPLAPREFPHVAAKQVTASSKPAQSLQLHKRQEPASGQNHAAPVHHAK